MKKFIIIIFLTIITVVAILGLAVLNANKLITQFKPQLENLASELIGIPIEFKDLSVTFLPQSAIKVSGFTAKKGDDGRDFGQGPAFEELLLSINLFSLIAGQLDINQIVILRPEITIIRGASGEKIKGINLPNKIKPKASPVSNAQNEISADQRQESKLKINLKSFELRKGLIKFEDQLNNRSYQISDIQLTTGLASSSETVTISNLILSGQASKGIVPFSIKIPQILIKDSTISLSSFNATLAQAIFNGSAEYNLDSYNGTATLYSSGVDVEQISLLSKDLLPLSQYGLTGTIIPDFTIKLEKPQGFSAGGTVGLSKVGASLGKLSASDLSSNIAIKTFGLDHSEFRSENLKLLLNGHSVTASFDGDFRNKSISFQNVAIAMLGGTINADFQMKLAEKGEFNSRINANRIKIEEALSLLSKAESFPLSGLLDNLSADLSGDPDLKESLKGSTSFRISNGLIKGWNLPALVLKALKNLPFLTEPLYSSLPASEREWLESNDTAFDSLEASLSFRGSGIKADSIEMRSALFSLQSTGNLGFDSSLDLSCSVIFNPQFSASLAERVRELRNGFDEKGQLVIPLKLQGKPPLVAVYPDLKKFLEGAGKKIIIEKSTDVLKDILKKKGLEGAFGF